MVKSKNKKEKKITNTDSKHFCLNPDDSIFLCEGYKSKSDKDLFNGLIEDYFK